MATVEEVRRMPLTGPVDGLVGRCRDFAFAALADWGRLPALDQRREDSVGDVLLIVSELVANACLHAGGATELALHNGAGRVRVEVTDRSHLRPVPRPPGDPAQPGGHGLRAVARLAEDWGCRPWEGGKTVWAAVTMPGNRASRTDVGERPVMSDEIRVEPLGDHEYLVRFPTTGDEVTSRFQATADTIDRLHVPGADEERIVAETAHFLAERQPTVDIPPMIDLDDVAAAYGDDYLEELGRRLSPL
ncbi:ATP-binding protein [Kitasatospora sp. LaBMicrA B282]|uniref:ATP-binding protein n=1 Tax=Kitasatospora sp. LaBMicrA B282 TaxID=3420949 RepID=UPI003D0F78D2